MFLPSPRYKPTAESAKTELLPGSRTWPMAHPGPENAGSRSSSGRFGNVRFWCAKARKDLADPKVQEELGR